MPEMVAVATYRRPALLRDCIDTLLPQLSDEDLLLIVDNDPEGSARAVVDQMESRIIRYVVEPTPGIAAARNRALEYFAEMNGRFAALSFVDDDETVCPAWLSNHIATAARYAADATFGPVHPVYLAETPSWVKRLDFFARAESSTGSSVKWPATNNVRICSDLLTTIPVLMFDERYSSTGGSDTDFFFRARQRGATLIWTSEGAVREVVPAGRANFRWLWRRGVRLGNVSARMLRRQGWSMARVLAVACARIVAAPLFAISASLARRPVGPMLMHIPKGVGMVRALRGRLVHEYGRHQAVGQ